MKFNLETNAHYDMVHGKPLPLEKDNDGLIFIRYNIQPEMGIPEGKTKEEQIGWKCYEVTTYDEPTKANIKKATVRSILDETEEFRLINNYNKHVMKIKVDEKAVAEYAEYLQLLEDIDAEIVKILSNN